MGLAEHWHGIEVETVERLARWQTGFGEMALNSTSGALGDFEFGERREESYGRPALFVGPRGDVLPEAVDGGQPQLVQQQRQPGGIDGDLAAHAKTSTASLLSNAS